MLEGNQKQEDTRRESILERNDTKFPFIMVFSLRTKTSQHHTGIKLKRKLSPNALKNQRTEFRKTQELLSEEQNIIQDPVRGNPNLSSLFFFPQKLFLRLNQMLPPYWTHHPQMNQVCLLELYKIIFYLLLHNSWSSIWRLPSSTLFRKYVAL